MDDNDEFIMVMMKKMMMMVDTMTDMMIMRFVVVGHNLHQDHNSSANLSRYHNNSDDIVNDNCNSQNNCKRLPSHTGQEQACTRITWLVGCLVVCHHAENEYTDK